MALNIPSAESKNRAKKAIRLRVKNMIKNVKTSSFLCMP